MSVLQALGEYYERIAARGEVEASGFSREKISFAVVLDARGEPSRIIDLREPTSRGPKAVQRDVPAATIRTIKITPYFLWDKSSYALGVTGGDPKLTSEQHRAFRQLHVELLADTPDVGLCALKTFLEKWSPDRFARPPFTVDMLDCNIVFCLEGDSGPDGSPRFIHERPAARQFVEARGAEGLVGTCLVSGANVPIARLHPKIKGVAGARSSGASLVSFNFDASESWGRTQGDNAPTGAVAALRYGTALNRLLDFHSRNRLQVGDTAVVFWADTAVSGEAMAKATDSYMLAMFGESDRQTDHDVQQSAKMREALRPLAAGQPVRITLGELHPDTRVYMLGLAPNAGRLSVRFWLTQSLGVLAQNLEAHERDCRVEPVPWGRPPSINFLLRKTTAAREEYENIPPLLAGQVAHAILNGGCYPRSMLSNTIMRLRAGGDLSGGWHAAVIRAVLERNKNLKISKKGAPMSLDRNETNSAYRLGRLFAVLEIAQRRALGPLNATIRDRYFGSASATPASVLPLLLRGGQHHLASLRKEGKAAGVERELEEIIRGLATQFPRSLRLEDQGRFVIGYYHQRAESFTKPDSVRTATSQKENVDADR